MCLAIYCPAGADVPIEHLVEGFRNNPHGAGFSFFDNKWKIRRQRYMKFEEFMDAYEEAKETYGNDSPFSIHFRYATHGTTNVDNVHPFMYNSDTSVIHNGIIDCMIDDPAMSDTASFVENYLSSLPREWYDNKFLFDMVEQYCVGSKLVVMTSNPKAKHSAYIVNESSGLWDNDVWYSNAGYCKRSPLAPKSFTKAHQELLSLGVEETFDDDGELFVDKCVLCDEDAVLDSMCYYCATCQLCLMEEVHCACDVPIHQMTDEQFKRGQTLI
jgi:glutamine amidotransferase